MINFRFHLVSLVAVFLALALGIVMGSTVVDQAIVDGLRAQIRRVERDSDSTREENDRLAGDLNRLGEYIDESAPYSVAGRLAGVPVVFVVERGVDDGAVVRTAELARTAGASAPVIVWLQPAWELDDEDTVARLAELTGSVADRDTLREQGLALLAERLGRPGPARRRTTTTTAAGSDVLDALDSAGFLTIQRVGDLDDGGIAAFPPEAPRAVLIGGTGSDVALDGFLAMVARAFVEREVPTVVAEAFAAREEGPERGALLEPVRADGELDDAVTTVDHLDMPQGRVATVLALEGLAAGRVGHYGYGDGADRGLPEWIGP